MGDFRPPLGTKSRTKETKENLTLLGQMGVRRPVTLWHEESNLFLIHIDLSGRKMVAFDWSEFFTVF